MFRYFFWTTLALILCAGIFVFTVTQLDPLGAQAIVALSLFFVSLFGTIWTVLTYLFFFGAELTEGHNLAEKKFTIALRRGLFVAIFCTTIVGLRFFNLLGWAEGVLLGAFLLLLELIFVTDSAKLPPK